MKKLLISLLTCAFILGHDVSAQAFSYEFDPDDIFMPADALHVFHGFDVRSEINDLSLITSATLSVYLNDIDPGIPSMHSARVDIHPAIVPIPTIGWAVWYEGDNVTSFVDNPNIITPLMTYGVFDMFVLYEPIAPGFDSPYAFDKAVLKVETSAIPIPGAIWLLGTGLVGLIGVARRKKV